MKNTEQAKSAMFNSLEKQLDDDEAVYELNDDYVTEVAAFKVAHATNKLAATKAHVDNSGFSNEKLVAKISLAEMASNLSGKAYVKFINLDKQSLAEQLVIEPTDYNKAADSQCANLAQTAHDFLETNIGDLGPNTITPLMLTGLQTSIDTFLNLQGSSETVHEVSPALTTQFKESYKPVMIHVEHLKLLTRDYKVINRAYYDRVMASSSIPTVNVHHTYVAINALGKTSGNAIEGVTFSLTTAKKSATTDWEGNAVIKEVKAGKDIITGVYKGNVVYTAHIVILRGKTIFISVLVEGV